MPITSPPIITVDDLGFHYGNESIFEHISFTIEKGAYVGIIGPNGGGKSTLLKVMLGILPSYHGTVTLFGTDQKKFKDWWRIGYLPQRSSQLEVTFPISVKEIVRQGRIGRVGLFHNFADTDYRAITKALAITTIEHLQDRLFHTLSGGEKQRVLIARALASEPEILMVDEPLVGVDVTTQEKFYTFLKKLNRELGLTIIFVSHDLDVIAEEASTLLCFNNGLVCHGPSRSVLTSATLQQLYGKNVQVIHHPT